MARDDDSESLHSEDTEDSELEASFDEADAEQLGAAGPLAPRGRTA
jgi:hypothetical protein